MPSWKKVIISGSNAALNSLTVTNGITGSLFGTASFASQALSASFASTSSFLNSATNAFIQNGNSFGATALLGTNDNQSLALETNGTTRMFISSSGNVGIGTTSPTGKLTIAPYATSNSSSIEFTNADNAVISSYYSQTFSVDNTNTQSGRQFVFAKGGKGYGTQTKTMMVIDADSGNVGIGTITPSYPLDVSASVSGTSIYATGDIVAFSDQSVKENIRPIENVLERIGDSRGVLYDRVDNGEKDNIGFIAQELEVAFPELVVTNPDGTKAVKYQNAVAVLFEAVKEQQKQINKILTLLNK